MTRPKTRPRLADVADAAGVSLATASRALNHRPEVRPETAAVVREAAADLGYAPNRIAQQLRSKRSGVVGLLVASMGNPAYEPYVMGAVQAAGQLGFGTFICDAEYDDALYRGHLRRLLEHRVDAVIISEQIAAPELLAPFGEAGVPVDPNPSDPVAVFGPARQESMRSVLREAYGELVRIGHRHIAYVKDARPGAPPRPRSEERIRALEETLESVEGGLASLWDVPGGQVGVEGFVSRTLSGDQRPSALVVSSMALHGVLAALDDLGLRVPDDISILCVGEVPWARFCNPPLSTIGSDQFERGASAARRVIATLHADPELAAQNPSPPFRYVRRASVGQRGGVATTP